MQLKKLTINKKFNKRGDISDPFIILIVLFFLAISFIIVGFVMVKLKFIVSDTVLNESQASSSIIEGFDNINNHSLQNGFLMIFGFLALGTMISSFLVRVHPAWMFIYIIFADLLAFISILLANAYNTFIENPTMKTIADTQPKINWVMVNLVKIMIGIQVLSMIILFAKLPETGGGF